MRVSLAFALLIGLSVHSQAAQLAAATVELSNFKFVPVNVRLQAGVPVVLHLNNVGSGGHSFSAPAFFAAAKLTPVTAALVKNGKVEVPGHSAVDLELIPAAGEFPLKCTHTLHSSFGMRAMIIVQ